MTFVEESASNVREHAGKGLPTYTGFVAANRTYRRYRDRERDQWVEVYTTYVSCYDLGRGILAALTEVPRFASELGGVQPGDRGLAALRLASRPGVSSQPGDGHGGGLPHMIQIVRDLDTTGDVADDGSTRRYRGVLQIVSDGAILESLTTTVRARHDRPLPGVQVHLWLQAIQRGARALQSEG
jgi:hypothetical protein